MKTFLKKVGKICWDWGLWLAPIVLAGLCWAYGKFRPGTPPEEIPWQLFLLITGSVCVYVYSQNLLYPRKETHSPDKIHAMYPEVDPKLLTRSPKGVVFGRDLTGKRQLVVKKPMMDGHVMIIGGSGSGKSSCLIIPTLLSNEKIGCFAVDIKGELSFKSQKIDDPNVIIIDPEDRSSYGWDPLWHLQGDDNDQTLLRTMKEIANILVPLRPDVKGPMWILNARTLLMGMMIGFYKRGKRDIVAIFDEILGRSTREAVNDILSTASEKSIEKKLLAEFPNSADETLSGFISEYKDHLNIFLESDIRYAMSVNPRKASPLDIEAGKKIFLRIKEENLEEWYDIFQLIIGQLLKALAKRSEKSNPVMVVLDELPRLTSRGKMTGLLDSIHTLRSRKVTLILVTQSTEALETAYSKSQVADMLANCLYMSVLDVRSLETAKAICALAGKYKEADHNWSVTRSRGKISTSFKDKDVLEISDLATLTQTHEAVIISPYGYFRIQKAPYYEDPSFKSRAEDIMRYNATIQELN